MGKEKPQSKQNRDYYNRAQINDRLPVMDRERQAWQEIKDNAYESINDSQVYEYDLQPRPTAQPNYITAFIWTVIVAAMVCAIYTGFLLFLFNQSGIEDNLKSAANHAIINLERVIESQNKEINLLRQQNKKIHDYLELWTPLDLQKQREMYEGKDKSRIEDSLWDLGAELPLHYNLCQEEPL